MVDLDYDTIRQNPNVRAFAYAINASEGSPTYNQTYGYGHIDDLADHPRKFFNYKGTPTSAAGGYQITSTTFNNLRKKYNGLGDFSPTSQDNALIALLQDNGSLKPLMNGDFDTALRRSSGTWASLPYSRAGQPKRSYSFVNNAYKTALENHNTNGSFLSFGSAAPAAQQGQAVTPDATQGQVATPDVQQGQAVTPDATQGQAVTPDATQGKAVTPDATQGQAVTPDATQAQQLQQLQQAQNAGYQNYTTDQALQSTPDDSYSLAAADSMSPNYLNDSFTTAYGDTLSTTPDFDANVFNTNLMQSRANQSSQDALASFVGRPSVNIVDLPNPINQYIAESINRQVRG